MKYLRITIYFIVLLTRCYNSFILGKSNKTFTFIHSLISFTFSVGHNGHEDLPIRLVLSLIMVNEPKHGGCKYITYVYVQSIPGWFYKYIYFTYHAFIHYEFTDVMWFGLI